MAGPVPAIHDFPCFSIASRGWPGQARPWRSENDRTTCPSGAEVKLPDQLVVVEFLNRAAFKLDMSMNDEISLVGDANCLGEVLLRHQDAELDSFLQLLDL